MDKELFPQPPIQTQDGIILQIQLNPIQQHTDKACKHHRRHQEGKRRRPFSLCLIHNQLHGNRQAYLKHGNNGYQH